MSSAEFEDWKVFYAIRPFGPWHDDYRIAMLNWSVSRMYGGSDAKVRDFMCVTPAPPPPPTNEQLAARAKAESINARLARKNV